MSVEGEKKKIAVYAGSFDPITRGHIDVIHRTLRIFDEVHVVVAINPGKKYGFSREDRLGFISDSLKGVKNLVVAYYGGLIIDYAKRVGAYVLIRGLRALSDFDYEFHMATINEDLCPEIQTVFITTGSKYFYINSSTIKDLARNRANISSFVPDCVARAFQRKQQDDETEKID